MQEALAIQKTSWLEQADPLVFSHLRREVERQQNCIDLIASENYASPAVLEAMGSVLSNKYSEGYPGKRYYAGNAVVDEVETLAIERCKFLFQAQHANVQPLTGAVANMAAYFAFLEPGDKLMGMRLDMGGHLTHGSPVNFSGKFYKVCSYGVSQETQMLDYDAIRKQALADKPKLIVCGYTAYPREIDFRAFREIADECGAFLMADIAHIAGLVAGGAHPSPIPFADVVTFTTHKTLRGPRSAAIIAKPDHSTRVDKAVFPGLQGGPQEHVIAAKAVCFKEAATPEFAEYAKQIVRNARALAGALLEFGFKISSGGTDNHLLLVDVTPKGLTGKPAQIALEKAGIVANMNALPYDARKPFDPSGLRFGTPAMTTRGLREGEMRFVASLIDKALTNASNDAALAGVRQDVEALCTQFPVYKELNQ